MNQNIKEIQKILNIFYKELRIINTYYLLLKEIKHAEKKGYNQALPFFKFPGFFNWTANAFSGEVIIGPSKLWKTRNGKTKRKKKPESYFFGRSYYKN